MGSTRPVFDYTASEPWLVSDRMRERFERSLDAGATVGTAWDRMDTEKARQLREDSAFRERVRETYSEAGVNLISPTLSSRDPNVEYARGVQRDLSHWQTRFDSVDWLEKVTTPAGARAVAERGNVGVVLNTQNLGADIDGDVDRIDELFDAGVRIFQLTYNRQNHLGTGCNDSSGGGLSDRGRDAVDRFNDLGGIVDFSHYGTQTTLDAVSHSSAPVAHTHTSCKSLSEHFRGKSDEELSALADADGYMGIVGLPWFLTPDRDRWNLEAWYENLDCAIDTLGSNWVGVGSDFYPADVKFEEPFVSHLKQQAISRGFPKEDIEQKRNFASGVGEMQSYTDWPVLRSGLADRYDEDTVTGIVGENFVDF